MIETMRKNLRLKEYDYSKTGVYYITVCCQNRLPLFEQEKAKQIVETWIHKLEEKYDPVVLDTYVIMPDHVHFILIKTETDDIPLSRMITWLKTMTTNAYIKEVLAHHLMPFEKRMWQRNYYEHVIRNEEDLNEKREYIINNPIKHRDKKYIPMYEDL